MNWKYINFRRYNAVCWLIFIMLAFSTITLAGNIEMNVSSNPRYRTFSISTALKRHLFIQTKGNVIMPNIGFFLDLSEEDAAKLNRTSIAYIPLDNQQYFEAQVRSFRINATKLSVNEAGIYFGKEYFDTDVHSTRTAKQNFLLKDTFQWASLLYYDDYTFTEEWIHLLDDTTPILVENMGYATTTDGCFPFYDYEFEPAQNIAKEKLAGLRLLFPEVHLDWSPSEWQKWFDHLMKYEDEPLSNCNPNVWNMPWRYGYNYKSIFYTNSFNHLIGVVASKPGNEDLINQQFVYFDQLKGKTYVYDLHTSKQPFNGVISSFVWNNNDLFFVTSGLKWIKYSYNSSNDMYEQNQSIALLPTDFLKPKEGIAIAQQYYNDTIAYYLVTKKQDALSSYYLLCVQMQTGKLLAYKSLQETLPQSVWKDLSFYKLKYVKYANINQDYFILGFQHTTKAMAYIVKIESNFEKTKCIALPQAMGWDPCIITTPNDIILADYASGVLKRTYISYDLDSIMKTQTLELLAPKELADYGYVYVTDSTINIISEYSDMMHNGLVKYALGIHDNAYKTSCVYFDIPIEERSSDNSKQIFYGSPNNKQSHTLFFKDGKTMRFVNVDY